MDVSRAEALSRTTRLVNEQLLGGSGVCDRIADLLADFTVQLVADMDVAATRAGQELILTANLLIRRMGMAVHTHVPDTPLVAPAPPYEGTSLHEALRGVVDELIPATRFGIDLADAAQVTFVLGGSSHAGAEPTLRVGLNDLCATVRPAAADTDARFDADSVLAALAAAGCVASQSLRAFLPSLTEAFGIEIRSHSFDLHHEIEINLEQLFPGLAGLPRTQQLGCIDFISAGAITNASVYTILHSDGLDADARVIEREDVDLSNLNRYMLALFGDLGKLKIRVLEGVGTARFRIRARLSCSPTRAGAGSYRSHHESSSAWMMSGRDGPSRKRSRAGYASARPKDSTPWSPRTGPARRAPAASIRSRTTTKPRSSRRSR